MDVHSCMNVKITAAAEDSAVNLLTVFPEVRHHSNNKENVQLCCLGLGIGIFLPGNTHICQ